MAELIVYMPDHVSGDRDPADVRGEIIGNLVRCKECKYAHLTYDGDCKFCDKITDDDGVPIERYHPGDWFCADGEKRE